MPPGMNDGYGVTMSKHTSEVFTKHDIATAHVARKLYAMLSHLSYVDFASMVCFNFIEIAPSLYMTFTVPLVSSKNVVLNIGVMFVCNLRFFMSGLQGIHLLSAACAHMHNQCTS